LNLSDRSMRRILHLDLHFHPLNCKSSRNLLLRTERCASVVAKRLCTRTITSGASSHETKQHSPSTAL
jgi:hypothetical protein